MTDGQRRTFKYYDLILGAFVCVLLCSNLIGVRKITQVELPLVGLFAFSAANLFFPISYLFGDVLTEVYGYARSRRVVWAGFAALAYASLQSVIIVALPPANDFKDQAMIEWAYGSTWRIAAASLIGYLCGEFVNSFILAKLKLVTKGRFLWVRTIGSTMGGELVDTLIFYPLAFYGVSWMPTDLMLKIMVANYFIKVGWEVAITPLTYKIVGFFKRAENVDHFDYGTNFTPFSLSVESAYTIRPIRPDDDAAVAAIIRGVMPSFGAQGPGFAINDPEVDAMYAEYTKPRSTYLVVVDPQGVVVGGGGVAPLAGGDPDTCELKKMYFLPEARGRGLGERLLRELLGEARRHGFTRIYLETLRGMDAAVKLYTKLGFTPAERAGATGHFGCDLFFARSLDDEP